jgi:hypothetical protein
VDEVRKAAAAANKATAAAAAANKATAAVEEIASELTIKTIKTAAEKVKTEALKAMQAEREAETAAKAAEAKVIAARRKAQEDAETAVRVRKEATAMAARREAETARREAETAARVTAASENVRNAENSVNMAKIASQSAKKALKDVQMLSPSSSGSNSVKKAAEAARNALNAAEVAEVARNTVAAAAKALNAALNAELTHAQREVAIKRVNSNAIKARDEAIQAIKAAQEVERASANCRLRVFRSIAEASMSTKERENRSLKLQAAKHFTTKTELRMHKIANTLYENENLYIFRNFGMINTKEKHCHLLSVLQAFLSCPAIITNILDKGNYFLNTHRQHKLIYDFFQRSITSSTDLDLEILSDYGKHIITHIQKNFIEDPEQKPTYYIDQQEALETLGYLINGLKLSEKQRVIDSFDYTSKKITICKHCKRQKTNLSEMYHLDVSIEDFNALSDIVNSNNEKSLSDAFAEMIMAKPSIVSLNCDTCYNREIDNHIQVEIFETLPEIFLVVSQFPNISEDEVMQGSRFTPNEFTLQSFRYRKVAQIYKISEKIKSGHYNVDCLRDGKVYNFEKNVFDLKVKEIRSMTEAYTLQFYHRA